MLIYIHTHTKCSNNLCSVEEIQIDFNFKIYSKK